MKRQVFALTELQKKALAALRARLGENGYLIVPVAEFFRRHESDFLAARRESPRQFFVVRPTAGGNVTLTPFMLRSLYYGVGQIVKDLRMKDSYPLLWSGHQLLKFARQRDGWWKEYFQPEAQAELGI